MHATKVALVLVLAVVGCDSLERSAEAKTPPSAPVRLAAAPAQPAAPPLNGATLPSLAPLVEMVKTAVVNVDVRAKSPSSGSGMDEHARELWERFFGQQAPPEQGPGQGDRFQRGVGSGFIISPDGLVLTNNHVVESAVAIEVKLNDGRLFEAEVLGRDPLTDVALIKLKGKVQKLPVVVLGDSETLRVGDWVVAIGNPFGLASTVSAGIVSAKAREIGAGPYDDFLQTDAAINPGNSGGPLFNLKGEVVGMNTAIVGGGTSIGFAVPSSLIRALLPQLQKEGVVTRGYMGVAVQSLDLDLATGLGVPVHEGALVSSVSKGSPGEKAGIKQDDVIVRLDDETILSSGQLTRRVALKHPGATVEVDLYRGKNKLTKTVKLGTRPDIEGVGVKKRSSAAPQDESQEKYGLTVRDAAPGTGGSGGNAAPEDVEGAEVVEVRPGSPAERAGLEPGMVIVEAGGKPVKGAADLRRVLNAAKPGSTTLLRVQAGGGRILRAITKPE